MEGEHVGSSRKRVKTSPQNCLSFPLTNQDDQTQTTSKNHQQDEPKSESKPPKSPNSIMPSSSSSSSSDLPSSIIIEILARLPIDTLLISCTHVSKSWRNMLSEPYFSKLYSLHHPATLLLRVKPDSHASLTSLQFVDSLSSPLTRRMRLASKRRGDNLRSPYGLEVGNSCNGVVCMQDTVRGEPRLIWTPIMGQVVVLPRPRPSTILGKVVAGLGFCGRTGRYKLIRIARADLDPSPPANGWRVEILDLGGGGGRGRDRDEEWRPIGDAPTWTFPVPSLAPGFYIQGSIHWIMDYNNNNINNKNPNFLNLISCFDFTDEVFRTIAPPPTFAGEGRKKYHWSNIGILGEGCLSICAVDKNVFRPDILVWVMEEYGVPDTWVTRLSIKDPAVDWWILDRWMQITNVLGNGDVVMLCARSFVLVYSVRERRYRSMEALEFPAVAHVPSFVSLEDVVGEGSLTVGYL